MSLTHDLYNQMLSNIFPVFPLFLWEENEKQKIDAKYAKGDECIYILKFSLNLANSDSKIKKSPIVTIYAIITYLDVIHTNK